MLNEELVKNYKKAIYQKYNAICFDIDGTLTKDNSTKIDDRILPFISDILKRHIPIVFITGRGEIGLHELLSDIIDNLKTKFNVTKNQLLKMYALTNDGARIFMTSSISEEIFNVSEYVSTKEDFIELDNLNNKIKPLINNSILNDYCKIIYSKDLKTNKIINIRIVLLSNNEVINNKIIEILNTLLTNTKSLNLTIGIHNNQNVIQIGTATKDKAIKVAEKIIGIPQNSMIRIGDCGDQNGNDYTMLNCSQGFSVGTTTGDNNMCFPVIENGKILKGVDATISLLKQIRLLPTVCLEHSTLEKYAKKYALIEKQIIQRRNKVIRQFNDLVNNKFATLDTGINGLFDSSSGSIKIPMYEWISIPDNNPLKQLWILNNNSNLCYSMYDNENILLRGPLTYYYLLSNRIHNNETHEDITTKEMIITWIDNNETFFSKFAEQLNKINDINELNNCKMILGIIDNIRNYLLILLNQQIINYNENKSLLLNLQSLQNNNLIYVIYTTLLQSEKLMKEITFNDDYLIDRLEINNLINQTITISKKFKFNFNKQIDKENYSKDFRAYREIDNFAENYITCYLISKDNLNFSNKGVCGLCYGGIELPILMKVLNDNLTDVSILKFNNSVTGYSKKQSIELRFFNIFENGNIDVCGIDRKKDYILFDDNLLTGKTMQLALTTFYDIGINVEEIVAVRHPGINRISQMFLPNHGAIDYRLFFDFIKGLYFPSPYSWRDPNSLNLYEDSLGIFDLNRRKIMECLVKNGNYSNYSELFYLKRR